MLIQLFLSLYCLSLLLLVFQIHIIFLILSHSFKLSSYGFLPSFHPLCISTWYDYVEIASSSLILSSAVLCLLMSHRRDSSFQLKCFWLPSFSVCLTHLFLNAVHLIHWRHSYINDSYFKFLLWNFNVCNSWDLSFFLVLFALQTCFYFLTFPLQKWNF